MPTSLSGPWADCGRSIDDDDCDLPNSFLFGAVDLHFAIEADFYQLSVTCKLAGVTKPAEMADVVAVAEAGLKFEQELPQKVALV